MAEIEEWRKRPIVVRMLQWDGSNEDQLRDFTGLDFHAVEPEDRTEDPDVTAEVWDRLHGTWVGVKTGQFVVCGVLGEHYPLDPKAREASFDPVREPTADPSNWQLVGGNGFGEIVVALPAARMSRERALTHAAWLVLVACGEKEFADYLDAARRAS